jgi:DNA-binding MarR family transcriptional regulator
MDISEEMQKEFLKRINEMEYEERILYILKSRGPQRFSHLNERAEMSKSSLSKYIKLHLQKNNIEKKIHEKAPHYFITEKGIEHLNKETTSPKKSSLFKDEIDETVLKASELIEYYRKIGVEESILFQILEILSKIGEEFFKLNQTPELFLTIFYIFMNSVLTKDYKFEINEFCRYYNVKKLHIDFYVDRIMSKKFGFYMFTRDNDVFFFHKKDILGSTTFKLIREQLIEEIIHIDLKGYRDYYDLDNIAEKIANRLLQMDLIWDRILEPFEMLIEKLFVKAAIDMGISKTFLMDLVVQSEKLSDSEQGINSLVNIIEGSENYEDLNIVSISKPQEGSVEALLDKIEGFCPNCGKAIKNNIKKVCQRCGQQYDLLLKRIDKANEISLKYKKRMLKQEELVSCPNPECEAKVSLEWDECPVCHNKIEAPKQKEN